VQNDFPRAKSQQRTTSNKESQLNRSFYTFFALIAGEMKSFALQN
jgi:hypothetical protein